MSQSSYTIFPGLMAMHESTLKEIVHRVYMFDDNEDFMKFGRKHPYIFAVQVYCALIRDYLQLSYMDIGEMMGRNHSTIIYAHKQVHSTHSEDAYLKIFKDKCYKEAESLKQSGQTDLSRKSIYTVEAIEALRILSSIN